MRDLNSISTRKLDEYLTALFADIEQDLKSPLLREFAVLSIGTMMKQRSEFPLSIYLNTYMGLIGESLSQDHATSFL